MRFCGLRRLRLFPTNRRGNFAHSISSSFNSIINGRRIKFYERKIQFCFFRLFPERLVAFQWRTRRKVNGFIKQSIKRLRNTRFRPSMKWRDEEPKQTQINWSGFTCVLGSRNWFVNNFFCSNLLEIALLNDLDRRLMSSFDQNFNFL